MELSTFREALAKKLRERIETHAARIRKGIPEREYLMSCGRIQAGEEAMNLMDEVIKQSKQEEDTSD